jgi:hypothetical protein
MAHKYVIMRLVTTCSELRLHMYEINVVSIRPSYVTCITRESVQLSYFYRELEALRLTPNLYDCSLSLHPLSASGTVVTAVDCFLRYLVWL